MIDFYFRYRLRGISYEKQRQKLARNGSVDTQKEIVMLSCHFFYLTTFNKTFVFIKKYLKLTNISWIFSCFSSSSSILINTNFSECKTAKKKLKKVKKEKDIRHELFLQKNTYLLTLSINDSPTYSLSKPIFKLVSQLVSQ